MNISINANRTTDRLDYFWRSTGFTPSSLLLNADMRQALAYLGSVPHGGITYVRLIIGNAFPLLRK